MNDYYDNMRLVWRGTGCKWVHRLEMQDGDVDCSDMTDAEFEVFVADKEEA